VSDKNYKKFSFTMIRTLNSMIHNMECDRCPPAFLGRNCCAGCSYLKTKINEFKRELGDVDDENKESDITLKKD